MISLPSLLSLAHLIGLALGVGAATVKLTLLLRCRADHALVPVHVKVAKPITRQIVSSGSLRQPPARPPHPISSIQKQYLTLEVMATGLFYVIITTWMLA
jgi:hypothetical protein